MVLSSVAKTKVLISFAVTAKLICVFVFAYAKIRFSQIEAHILAQVERISVVGEYKFRDLGHSLHIV